MNPICISPDFHKFVSTHYGAIFEVFDELVNSPQQTFIALIFSL